MIAKILTLGGTGLVGSRVNELLSKKYQITNLSTKSGVDIVKPETLSALKKIGHQCLILYAAKADVDSCEKDLELGKKGEAYLTNVTGVQNIIKIVQTTGQKLIYISTDFVFDGNNPPAGGYTEKYPPNPLNWYGQTKYLGEQAILNSGISNLIIRIGYPYRDDNFPKKDFFRAIRDRLKNNLPIQAVTDHIMTPTYIDDIATALEKLLTQNKTGIYHVTGSQSLTPYEASIIIAQKNNLKKSLISQTSRKMFFKDRAPRPFNLTVNNGKIRTLGVKMRSFEDGITPSSS
jgi:dTDP-4-dehydrorhamnose reductase